MIVEQPYEPLAAQVRSLIRDEHDLNLALAMMNQARIRSTPIDPAQVIYLLGIGYRAGWIAATDEIRATEETR
jgi:hypothetical protein